MHNTNDSEQHWYRRLANLFKSMTLVQASVTTLLSGDFKNNN